MTALTAPTEPATAPPAKKRRGTKSPYPFWFYLPGGVFYIILFLIPTGASLYFALTRWTLFDQEFIGLDNFVQFFNEPALVTVSSTLSSTHS